MMQFKRYLDAYMSLFSAEASMYASRTRPLTLFSIPQDEAIMIIQRVETIVRKETNLLNLTPPITIVGDLHGQFLDLIRIFQKNGIPPNKKFLFLGDLVDRGEFSFDILIFLFILKIIYPENVYFIRGNHEFNSLSSSCGFLNEIIDKYSEPSVYNSFLNVFNVMPIAALINDKILCLHGGLGPNFNSIGQINKINRPLCEFGQSDVADEILWSDPSNDVEAYEPSVRGAGYFFGKAVVDQFCENNNIDLIIRGHECVMDGFEKFFDGKLITLFSASNSTGTVGNESAIIEVKSDMSRIIKQYPPLPYLLRHEVFYSTHLRVMNNSFATPQPPTIPVRSSPRKLTRANQHANSNKDVSMIRRESLYNSNLCENVSSSTKNLPKWRQAAAALPSLLTERQLFISHNYSSSISGSERKAKNLLAFESHQHHSQAQQQQQKQRCDPISSSTTPPPLSNQHLNQRQREGFVVVQPTAQPLMAPVRRPNSNRRKRKVPLY